MAKERTKIFEEVAEYYSAKLRMFGLTPKGVDWNGEASQYLRFEQLIKIFGDRKVVSVNDLGCGYGALLDFLLAQNLEISYFGLDVSEDMIEAAINKYKNITVAGFKVGGEIETLADYGIASGIFNVKQEQPENDWLEYIENSLDNLDQTSRLGFSFNCLTSYSDTDRKKNYLYYADPSYLFDLCKRKYSKNVALLHDYDLFEFTILVRKNYE